MKRVLCIAACLFVLLMTIAVPSFADETDTGESAGTYVVDVPEIGDGGYNQGFQDGQIAGYDQGYTDGYDNGLNNGLITGFDRGYAQGSQDGWEQGHVDGWSAGHEQGVTETLNGRSTLKSLIFNIFDAPFYVLSSVLDFDLFGINIGSTFVAIITLALIVMIAKVIIVKIF